VTCTDVTYTPASASRRQDGTLCLPNEVTTDTVILLVHGGGGFEGTRTDLHAWQRFYAGRGVPTLSIDYALTGDRGVTPIYPLAEQNVKAAVEYLRLEQEALGTDRVVVQGHSAGARLGAIALTTPDEPYFSGRELRDDVSDAIDGFVGFYGYYGGWQFQADAYFGGAPRRTGNSVVNAARATGPALLVHGSDDGFVPERRTLRFADALRAAGRTVEVELVTAAGHGFDGYARPALTAEGRRSARHIVDWLSTA
jgi:acetyl esterase/lipase